MLASDVGSRRIVLSDGCLADFVEPKKANDRIIDSNPQYIGAKKIMQGGTKGGNEAASTSIFVTTGTEGMLTNNIGERLIGVRAQVMTWDDRYSGWLPLEGGGVSNVTLYQRVCSGSGSDGSSGTASQHEPPANSASKFEYVVRGERVEDKKVSLYCQLRKDINYRQVMPTFHHWQIDERKFGLKFMSSYEACKFHNRLQKAIEHLYRQSKSSSGDSNVETDDLEDDVFVPVELPLSRAESWESGSTSRSVPATGAPGPSTGLLRTAFPSYSATAVPALVHQPAASTSEAKKKKSTASAAIMPPSSGDTTGRKPGRTKTWPKSPAELSSAGPSVMQTSGNFPYVYFQKDPCKATAYTKLSQPSQRPTSKMSIQPSASFGQLAPHPPRPFSVGRSSPLEKRGSVSSLKLSLVHQQLTLPTASSSGPSFLFGGGRKQTRAGASGSSPMDILRRERCFYCKAYYVERDNRRGACPDAPDPWAKWLRRVTCLWCAECVLYCCCRDWSDGEAPRDVCSCSPTDPVRRKRWTLLAILAIFVPCLLCYPPMSACHRCCRRRWPAFGGRHTPSGLGARQTPGGRSASVSRKSMTPEPSSAYK